METFKVITGGVNMRHPLSYKMSKPNGISCFVVLNTKTNALFSIKDKQIKGKPNSVIIIPPNTPYFYENPEGHYIDDWLRFETPNPEYFQALGLPFNCFIFPEDPHHINMMFQEIVWEFNYGSEQFKGKNISLLFQVLFNKLMADYIKQENAEQYSPFYSIIRELRLKIQSDPSATYTAEDVAKKLEISTSYFQHLYKNLFGISFQKDLINLRVDNVKYLISNTETSLKEIAEICGYSSEVHFYRQFKKITGRTPSEYRKLYLKENDIRILENQNQ